MQKLVSWEEATVVIISSTLLSMYFDYFLLKQGTPYILDSLKISSNISNIVPTIQEARLQFWITIATGVYLFLKRDHLLPERQYSMKYSYVHAMEKYFNKKFEKQFATIKEIRSRQLLLAIIIFENFNRNTFIRGLERIGKFLGVKRIKTTGIAQIKDTNSLSDEESIKKEIKKMLDAFKDYRIDHSQKPEDISLFEKYLEERNGNDYSRRVIEVYTMLRH